MVPVMPTPDLVIYSTRVVTPEGTGPAAVVVEHGVVRAVEPPPGPAIANRLDVGHLIVMPGLVDTHVHVNEPGRTEWEGFETAARAAAAGGVTTLVDMPLNSSPVTTSVEALEAKRDAAAARCGVDYGFWGGVVPGNAAHLPALAEAGVLGFKCFLAPSGLDEFPPVTEADLHEAMPALAALDAVLLVHAEAPGPLERAAGGSGDARSYRRYLASRPREAEHEAIALLLRLAAEYGCRVHVVHLSSAGALPLLREARRNGVPLTVETCPHYLTFAAEEIPDGATLFKCAPPIRERENRERLWDALRDGEIDMIASDHSPCPPELKRLEAGNFDGAWGGVSSLQLTLAAVWTEARRRHVSPDALARWLGERPARLAGVSHCKGRIAPGYDADLVVWDPDAEWTVDAARLHHRHAVTPYAGRALHGAVRQVFLRGNPISHDGRVTNGRPGRWLRGCMRVV
jgi:allantoinase